MNSEVEYETNQYTQLRSTYTERRTAQKKNSPDNKVHEANMGPTWVLSATGGPHDGTWTLLSGSAHMIQL